MQSVGRGEATNTPYLVVGEVSRAEKHSAYIVHKTPNMHLSEEFRRNLLLAGPGEQLKMLYAGTLLERWRDGQLGVGSRTNCPAVYLIQGKQVRFFAFPILPQASVNVAHDTQSTSRYDYGEPFVGETRDLTSMFLVTAQGILKKETPQEVAKKRAATTANLIKWQYQQASNGVARVQYDLATRYFSGDGVQKDESVGHYWLDRSASQSYEPALKLRETLPSPP